MSKSSAGPVLAFPLLPGWRALALFLGFAFPRAGICSSPSKIATGLFIIRLWLERSNDF